MQHVADQRLTDAEDTSSAALGTAHDGTVFSAATQVLPRRVLTVKDPGGACLGRLAAQSVAAVGGLVNGDVR